MIWRILQIILGKVLLGKRWLHNYKKKKNSILYKFKSNNNKTPVNSISMPLTEVLILIAIRLISTNFYTFICFANFPFLMFQSYIPGNIYFTGFTVIFDCSKAAAFQPYPPNFILGENSFCILKFPISDFSNLGVKFFPPKLWSNKNKNHFTISLAFMHLYCFHLIPLQSNVLFYRK